MLKKIFAIAVTIGVSIFDTKIVVALSPEEISQVVKPYTVLITSDSGSVSGVMVNKSQNIYTLITTASKVAGAKNITIVTADGKKYKVSPSDVRTPDSQVDLLIIKFTTSQNYQVPPILPTSSLLTKGTEVYITGFPTPTQTISAPVYSFRPGVFQVRLPSASQSGYTLSYTGSLLPGMEGGGIFDKNGTLIGIHGRVQSSSEVTDPISPNVKFQANSNLGIPIGTFVKLTTSAPTSSDSGIVFSPTTQGVTVDSKKFQQLISGLNRSNQRYVAAAKLHRQRKYQEAIALYTVSIDEYAKTATSGAGNSTPSNAFLVMALKGRVESKYSSGDRQGALNDLEMALKYTPEDPQLYIQSGLISEQLGDKSKAIKFLQTASSIYQKTGAVANAEKVDRAILKIKQSR
jgi:serine protease Do